MSTSPGPVTVTSDDGWEAQSWSEGGYAQTEDQMRAALADQPIPPSPPAAPSPPGPDGASAPEPSSTAADSAAAEGVPPSEAAPVSDEPTKGEEADKPPPKRANRVQELHKQINTLTATKHATLREMEAARQELEALQAQLREAKARTASPSAPDATRAADAGATVGLGPMPTWQDYENDPDPDKDFDAFQRDLAAWYDRRTQLLAESAAARAREEARTEWEQRQQEAAIQSAAQAFQERVVAAREKYADFDTVRKDGWTGVPRTPFLEELVQGHPAGLDVLYQIGKDRVAAATLASLTGGDPNQFRPLRWLVAKMADPTPVLLHFAQHPNEFERITSLPVADQLSELGVLRNRLSGASGSPGKPRLTTSAPDPIKPIAGQRTSGPTASPDDMEFSPEYVAAQNKRDLARGRRLSS